jgi:hypothetical protein
LPFTKVPQGIAARGLPSAQTRFSFNDARLEPFERGFEPFSLVDRLQMKIFGEPG